MDQCFVHIEEQSVSVGCPRQVDFIPSELFPLDESLDVVHLDLLLFAVGNVLVPISEISAAVVSKVYSFVISFARF